MSTQQKAKSKSVADGIKGNLESALTASEQYSEEATELAQTTKRGKKPGTSTRTEQRQRAKESKAHLVAVYGLASTELANQLLKEQHKGNVVILVPNNIVIDKATEIAVLQRSAIDAANELVVIAVNNQVEVSTFALVNYAASKKKLVRFENGLALTDSTETSEVASNQIDLITADNTDNTDNVTETLTAQ